MWGTASHEHKFKKKKKISGTSELLREGKERQEVSVFPCIYWARQLIYNLENHQNVIDPPSGNS